MRARRSAFTKQRSDRASQTFLRGSVSLCSGPCAGQDGPTQVTQRHRAVEIPLESLSAGSGLICWQNVWGVCKQMEALSRSPVLTAAGGRWAAQPSPGRQRTNELNNFSFHIFKNLLLSKFSISTNCCDLSVLPSPPLILRVPGVNSCRSVKLDRVSPLEARVLVAGLKNALPRGDPGSGKEMTPRLPLAMQLFATAPASTVCKSWGENSRALP